jgi:signal transduction histidine kinase
MTLRTRLSLTIAAIAILLVLPAAYAVGRLNSLRELAEAQRSQHGAAYIALGRLQSSLGELRRHTTEYIVAPEPGPRVRMIAMLDTVRTHIRDLERLGYPLHARRVAESVNRVGVAARRIELLMEADRREEATDQLDPARAEITQADTALVAIAEEIDRRSNADLERASTISTTAARTAVIALGICAAVAVLLGVWTTRALTQPVIRLRNAMAVVADGNFTVPRNLAYGRTDEIGSASRSFRAMTHRLADLERLKAEFLSFATHELRTPLNVVSGYADLLKEGTYGDLSASQAEAVDAIRDQTRIIAQLVNQLLDIGRLEAGGLRVHVRNVSSAEFFQRVERTFEPLARKKSIFLNVDIDPSVPDTIAVDADRLADQVLGNLLSNALKFTPEHGQIRVRAIQLDSALSIEVTDNGQGIPADKLAQIFERYYQVSDEARRKGAGLGLSIARDVVRAHGGTIHAESEPGKGTTFRVMIPSSGRRQYAALRA